MHVRTNALTFHVRPPNKQSAASDYYVPEAKVNVCLCFAFFCLSVRFNCRNRRAINKLVCSYTFVLKQYMYVFVSLSLSLTFLCLVNKLEWLSLHSSRCRPWGEKWDQANRDHIITNRTKMYACKCCREPIGQVTFFVSSALLTLMG